jgi:hypothetical protein
MTRISKETWLNAPASRVAPVVAVALLTATPAEAYVDPGTGGMLVQLLLGGMMAGLVAMRSGLRRVLDWIRRAPSRREHEQ